ncbi:MAG: phosphotransferase [Paracoccaceae bacterium]|nr:phosphotransferase [Paracoccaceae bacterium]
MPDAFLAAAGWGGATRTPLAGDASRRLYERLTLGEARAVLMIAPEGSAADIRRFADLAAHLRGLGLSAPNVLADNAEAGLMLLEDFGDRLYPAAIAAEPALEPRLYRAAIDCLFVLQRAAPPSGITVFSAGEMADQASLAFTAYGRADPGRQRGFAEALEEALEKVAGPPVLMLRDFHAENLFWLPDRAGPAAVGLIDFQDARLASPLYDIVSLLWDARRDLDIGLRSNLLKRVADRLGRTFADISADTATLLLQRNLRILGIFTRLALQDGKPRYLDHVPRVWGYIEEALAAPHLAPLAPLVRQGLPAPTEAYLARFRSTCQPTPTP